MQLLWLKRDLRLQDHEPFRRAFAHSGENGAILPVYIHEPSVIGQRDFSAQHSGFIGETLDELHEELILLGGALAEYVGEAVDVFEALWQAQPFKYLWAHQETGTAITFARDKAVHAWCVSRNVIFNESPQNAVRRGSEYRRDGFQFKHYLDNACEAELFCPKRDIPFAQSVLPNARRSAVPVGNGEDKPGRLKGGRRAAMAALDDFVRLEKLMAYPTAISSPNSAPTGCSRLSPYLALGIVSDREVFRRLNNTVNSASSKLPDGQAKALQNSVQFYAERMYWRCAYLQSFERRISSELKNDLSAFDGIRESELCVEWLDAWKAGRTGYPMVDAAMRMLAETGWLNMRMRGMVTSFAVNELWLPWREVGLHLAQEFLDYEPGIHWNQLNIHSGTSRLSGPLTYNVVKQALDHDPNGTFVRKWLPALSAVPSEHLPEPWKMPAAVQAAANCRIGIDFPAPIVPHLAANDAARERVAALREGRPVPNSVYWKGRDQARMASKQDSLF